MEITKHGTELASKVTNSYTSTTPTQAEPKAQSQTNIAPSSSQIQDNIDEAKQKHDTEEKKKQLNDLAQQLNKELGPLSTNITFGFSEDIQGLYITVSEKGTNRLIRKIPSDEAMELMAKMKELVGMIFDKQI